MAGAGSKGYPNGVPIDDEWGIRMEQGSCNPQPGASVTRGGGANGPAAVYAIRKWDEWLRQYAHQVLRHMTTAVTTSTVSNCCAADLLVHGVYCVNGCSKIRREQHS